MATLNRKYLSNSLRGKLVADLSHHKINCSLSPSIQTLSDKGKAYHSRFQSGEAVEAISQAVNNIEALQERKILAVANSFDFYVDTLPDSTLIKSGVFNQFKPLVISGVSGIMMDEKIFAGDSITHRLPEFFKVFLQKHLQFDGLIFGNITNTISLEELIYAGATIFMVDEADFETNYLQLRQMVENGTISEEVIDEKIKKILLAKKWLDLDKVNYGSTLSPTYVTKKNSQTERLYTRELFEHSIILANNPDSLLPFKTLYGKQYKVVNIGPNRLRNFQNSFFNYANASQDLYRPKKDGQINALAFNPIRNGAYILTFDELNLDPEENQFFIESVNKINETSAVIVVNFGNPRNLQLLDSTITAIQVFERNAITEQLVPQLLFGAIDAKGTLPVTLANWLPAGKQITTPIIRLKYTIPEEVGIASEKLDKIEAIITSAIRQKATPGGQVLIAKQGKVIYSKTFGHHTYERERLVENTDKYDLASITKPAATTLAAMQLYEEGLIDLEGTLEDQMDLSKKATIKRIKLKDLFIHKSGLQRNMPIATYLNNRGIPRECTQYFCQQITDKHTLEVAQNFYMNPVFLDSIYKAVSVLPRNYRSRKYLYSDVNFYLIHQLIEERIPVNMDEFLKSNFYQPLGLRNLTFKPLDRFTEDVIIPTQEDKFWRKGLVRGYVHDEAAAILGGVGGNAGLFSNVNDLAVLFQMLLNGGHYGGEKFLEKSTIDYFTSANHGNHRGLGFDKSRYNYTASKSASRLTYGHSGFSGTCVWVDPQEELIYIFLSNRIHPDARNDRLKKLRVRQRIHNTIYEAIKSGKSDARVINMAGE